MRPPLSSRSSTKPRGSKFAHTHKAILASSYFDDIIVIEVKKKRKILIRFLEFPSVKFLKIWQRSYSLLVWVQMNVVPRSTGNTNSGTRELTLKCKLKCYFKPMNNPLGVSPSKGKQGTTRGKEKFF